MKKILYSILLAVFILVLAGCGGKEAVNNGDIENPQNETVTASKTLPDSYPKENLPLAADAEILDVRENPANKGLEVSYVSDNDIDTLCDFYEGVFQDAEDLNTTETQDGYMITAKMDDVDYTIMLSKDAMRSNPKYAGKTSVYLILIGLEAVSGGATQIPEGEGEKWPSAELPGVPQLKGHISQILRDGTVRLEITVDNSERVKSYISELTAAGFSFDTHPDIESDHMEFLAFKDGDMMSFSYKGEENLVSIEYQNAG